MIAASFLGLHVFSFFSRFLQHRNIVFVLPPGGVCRSGPHNMELQTYMWRRCLISRNKRCRAFLLKVNMRRRCGTSHHLFCLDVLHRHPWTPGSSFRTGAQRRRRDCTSVQPFTCGLASAVTGIKPKLILILCTAVAVCWFPISGAHVMGTTGVMPSAACRG